MSIPASIASLPARTPDLALFRLRKLAAAHPELAGLFRHPIDAAALQRRCAQPQIGHRFPIVRGQTMAFSSGPMLR